MASSSHKGAISFGLVHIPVALYTATRENKIAFNMLHRDTHERIRLQKVRGNGIEVSPEEIVKGYEHEKGQYVVMEDADFEAIKTERDKTIQILHFADFNDVPAIYYEKSYYAIPDAGGDRAFELLRVAMGKANKVAIARTVIGTSETLLALIPTKDGILAETLFFAEEIKPMPKAYHKPALDDAELEMAGKLIAAMEKPFEPENYTDEYQGRLREAIARKIAGEELVSPQPEPAATIINLMDALQASLERRGDTASKPKPRRKATAK